MAKMNSLFVIIGLCVFALGCKAERDASSLYGADESGILVVDGLLIVDKPLPSIFVRQTVGPGQIYTRQAAAVTDAEVVVATGGQTVVYRADPDSLGRYLPPANAPLVLPERTYSLTVRSQGRQARAQTTTPGRLSVVDAVLLDDQTLAVIRRFKTFKDGKEVVYTAPENQVAYQEGLLEARFNPLAVKGYQVGIESLDRDSELVLESDLLDEKDYADLERYGSSPAFEAKDGTLRLPWFAVYYGGRHVLRFFAVDDNWFDLIRSVPEFFQDGDANAFQPGGLAGDNFERPFFHVEGGIGIFGSASMDSLGFFVQPKK